jgi:hypothetical protein
VTTESNYPFGDDATITVDVPSGHATTLLVRIPVWAAAATLDAKPVANGTHVSVACSAGRSAFHLQLNPAIRLTRGWGVMQGPDIPAVVPHASDPTAVVVVPSSTTSDWHAEDGATFVPSRVPPSLDARTGAPGQVSSLVGAHAIFGRGHDLSSVSVGLTYVSGYSPAPGQHKKGCNVTLHALDAETGSDLGLLWASPELSAYSYDHFTGYSKPVNGSVTGLKIPNSKPIRLALKVHNNERNLHFRVADLTLSVSWTSKAEHSTTTSGVASLDICNKYPIGSKRIETGALPKFRGDRNDNSEEDKNAAAQQLRSVMSGGIGGDSAHNEVLLWVRKRPAGSRHESIDEGVVNSEKRAFLRKHILVEHVPISVSTQVRIESCLDSASGAL